MVNEVERDFAIGARFPGALRRGTGGTRLGFPVLALGWALGATGCGDPTHRSPRRNDGWGTVRPSGAGAGRDGDFSRFDEETGGWGVLIFRALALMGYCSFEQAWISTEVPGSEGVPWSDSGFEAGVSGSSGVSGSGAGGSGFVGGRPAGRYCRGRPVRATWAR